MATSFNLEVSATPFSLDIIATQNTTDRSVAPLDAALRRRFAFYRMEPQFEYESDDSSFSKTVQTWRDINGILNQKIGPDAKLGQSYLYTLQDRLKNSDLSFSEYELIGLTWEHEILPQLIDTLMSVKRSNKKVSD